MAGQEKTITELNRVLEKILDAAKDGQDGSATYALDRLRLIQQYAKIGLRKTAARSSAMEPGEMSEGFGRRLLHPWR